MEMKINFNKLFQISDSDSRAPSTTSLQNSYHFDEPSVMSYTSNRINLHYKFNEALFFDSQATMQNEQQMNILGDLSSIGRSFEDSFEKQPPLKQAQKQQKSSKQTGKVNKDKKQEQFFTKQTFGIGQKNPKTAGQRLYYEHKINEERKLREVERLRMQKQEEQKKQITFKPAINEKSKKILQLADSPLRKLENFKKGLKQKQQPEQVKSTAQKKYEQDMKNCTFKPAVSKTPKNKFRMNTLNERRQKDQVFQQLYNDHMTKQMKRKQAESEQSKRQKKMTQEQLQEFLNRNEQYLQQKLHKEELMRAVSSQYDLSSGRKLFEPKINETSEALLSSILVKKIVSTPSSKKFILHEESNQSSGFDSKGYLNSDKSKSGKSKRGKSGKSRSSSQKNKNIESKKALFQKFANNEQGKKKMQKQERVKKDIQKKTSNQRQFKPLPYQLTKVRNVNLDEKETQKNKASKGDQDLNNTGYERPLSTIFTKIKATESVFEDKDEDESNNSEIEYMISQRKQSYTNQAEKQKRSVDQNRQSDAKSSNQQEKINDLGNGQDQEIYFEQTPDRQYVYDTSNQFIDQEYEYKEKVRDYSQQVGYTDYQQTPQHFIPQQKALYAEKYPSQSYSQHPIQKWSDSLFTQNQKNQSQRESDEDQYELRKDVQFDTVKRYQQEGHLPQNYQENRCSLSEEHQQHEFNTKQEKDRQVEHNSYYHEQRQQTHQEEQNPKQDHNLPSHHLQTLPQQEQEEIKSSISSNPQNNQQYQNLFQLGQQINQSHRSSPKTHRESCSSDELHQNPVNIDHQDPLNIEAITNFLNDTNQPLNIHSSIRDLGYHEVVSNKVLQSPDVPSSSQFQTCQNVAQQKPTQEVRKPQQNSKKNWQEIFNSSAYTLQQPNPYQSQNSSRLKKKSQESKEPQTGLQAQESPKKKPINIASLLKGKKKVPLKP